MEWFSFGLKDISQRNGLKKEKPNIINTTVPLSKMPLVMDKSELEYL
jgi:hypothetical protein